MGQKSNIQWTDATWNIARGCSKVDADCKYCYMFRDSMKGTRYKADTVVKTKGAFLMPLKFKETVSKVREGSRPLIFTSSLTDVFHDQCDPFRPEMWDIIRDCPHLIFQILTKRPENICVSLPSFWPEIRERVWLGTSIGSQAGMDRLMDLVDPVTAGTKFLSLEPLHGPIALNLGRQVNENHKVGDLIHWVIIGGESGNETGIYRYRPCEIDWMLEIMAECAVFNIPVFVKQMGTHLAKKLGMSDRHGGNMAEFPLPNFLHRREFPVPSVGVLGYMTSEL